MRASHIALFAAVMAIPCVGNAQQDHGPVNSRVGPEGPSSLGEPHPSLGAGPTTDSGAPGQIVWRQIFVDGVPQNVLVTPRAGGIGSALINGHRMLVDLNTNVVLQQDNGPAGGMVRPQGSSEPRPSLLGSPYGPPPAGLVVGTMPGQVVPQNVPVMPRPDGTGTAWVNGHRVLVNPNTNRILRVFN
jgi:hypothetical protein